VGRKRVMNFVKSAWLTDCSKYPAMPSLFFSGARGVYQSVLYNRRRHVGVTVWLQEDGTGRETPGPILLADASCSDRSSSLGSVKFPGISREVCARAPGEPKYVVGATVCT
jgi:hypothetical protein